MKIRVWNTKEQPCQLPSAKEWIQPWQNSRSYLKPLGPLGDTSDSLGAIPLGILLYGELREIEEIKLAVKLSFQLGHEKIWESNIFHTGTQHAQLTTR